MTKIVHLRCEYSVTVEAMLGTNAIEDLCTSTEYDEHQQKRVPMSIVGNSTKYEVK